MYMVLPSVTINIVGQNYKKGANVKCKKGATSHSFNPFGWKLSKDFQVYIINLTSQ